MKQFEHRELPPEQVVTWLRSRAGQNWSSRHGHVLERHRVDSGVFADVLPVPGGAACASWPDPGAWDIDYPAWWTTLDVDDTR